jgi:fibrillarin-like pre-rRNA processing protein
MKQFKNFKEVYERPKGKRFSLLTKSLNPGKRVYGENLRREKGVEYREWDPNRSKLAAALMKGVKEIGIQEGSYVLYLGAASGTTPSHISDIVGNNGFIYAIDFAPRVVRELTFLAEQRKNIAPILADASKPETYYKNISEVDIIYQDIAQREQAEIFLNNFRFLKNNGIALLCVKAKSVDVAKKPKQIFKELREFLNKNNVKIIDYRELDPFEKDHCIFVCKKH